MVTPLQDYKFLNKGWITDKTPSLSYLRSVALCLIGYAGFFRFRELCHIKACDVKFFPSYVSIFLESSKCDQFRDGAWIVIARTDLTTCPVNALEEYISAAQINLSEDLPLFRVLATPRSKVRSQGNSYRRARELIKDVFRDITNVSKISVHSLRAGGATSVANAGIADRLFKRHGRWASENAKVGYVKDDFNSRLSATKSLGIWFILYCYLLTYFFFLNRARQVGRVLSTGPGFFLSCFRSERGEVFSSCGCSLVLSQV